jgi:malonate-semialdehyde dehydrogenase (acetylating)/methylmalonate-semialdehyde dehydrogenase
VTSGEPDGGHGQWLAARLGGKVAGDGVRVAGATKGQVDTMTQVAEPGSAQARTQGSEAAAVGAVHHWIGGRIVEGTSGRRGPVYDPATGRVAREVDFASVDEVAAAVAAAKAAHPAWRATSLSKRTDILFKIRNLVELRRKELAAHLTAEHGKVPSDALGEIARGLENLEFACSIPNLLKGGFTEQASTGVDVFQIRQPLGVVAGITPFNFPAMVPMWMFATAIATGNTFILKPSEKDPSASMFIAELLHAAGVPDGVFNVVHGDKVAVDALLEHPDIAAVSFVGSTPIARYIYETGTKNGKRVQALGGAKNHMIVLPDADIDMAADAAISAGYGSAGERCMAIATIVAVGNVADPLVEAITKRLPKVKVGPGSDPESEMGPLVTKQHRDKVASYLDSSAAQGATVVADGREHPLFKDSDGFFLGVSLIDYVSTEMDAYKDEIFGPVLTVIRVPTYEEAVHLVNDNPYGNGTAIFTRDGGAARQFQFEVNAGMVGINVPIPVPVAYYSFGGWKNSLFGDLHMYGPEGIQFYTRAKIVTQRWPDPGTSKIDLGFPRTR